MNPLIITGYVVLTLMVVFLLSGLFFSFLGEKQEVQGKTRIIIKVRGQHVEFPDRTQYAMFFVGLILLVITVSIFTQTHQDYVVNYKPTSFLLRSVYAHESNPLDEKEREGWVYFGYEKNYKTWNFEYLEGDFQQMMINKSGVLLKSKEDLNVRKDHFGDFTGTVLEFLSPKPKKIDELKQGQCIKVNDVMSVGFSKIWIRFTRNKCS